MTKRTAVTPKNQTLFLPGGFQPNLAAAGLSAMDALQYRKDLYIRLSPDPNKGTGPKFMVIIGCP